MTTLAADPTYWLCLECGKNHRLTAQGRVTMRTHCIFAGQRPMDKLLYLLYSGSGKAQGIRPDFWHRHFKSGFFA